MDRKKKTGLIDNSKLGPVLVCFSEALHSTHAYIFNIYLHIYGHTFGICTASQHIDNALSPLLNLIVIKVSYLIVNVKMTALCVAFMI